MKDDQLIDIQLAQNQLLDETVYFNDYKITQQVEDYKKIGRKLQRLKDNLAELQRQHRAEIMSRSDVVNLNTVDLEKL